MDLYVGVNALLGAIGEVPITSVEAQDAEAVSDVGIARDTLLAISKMIQTRGYWFNREVDYPLVPNTSGYIPIGESILSVKGTNLIEKDHKLYDVAKRSFIFDTPQKVDVIFYVEFDDLPQVVADTIVREATVSYYNNVLGDTQELRILQENAQRAQIELQKEQARQRKTNLISGSRLVSRTQNPIGVI